MMDIKPIRTEKDYREALELASKYFDHEPEVNTPEGDTFDILLTLIESYEAKNFVIGLPDPIEAIKFRLEQSGKTIRDLSPMIGKMNRVYEIMNGKRLLTLGMIRRIHTQLGVPADSLIMQAQSPLPEAKIVAGQYVSRPRAQRQSATAHSVKLSSGKKLKTSVTTTRIRQAF